VSGDGCTVMVTGGAIAGADIDSRAWPIDVTATTWTMAVPLVTPSSLRYVSTCGESKIHSTIEKKVGKTWEYRVAMIDRGYPVIVQKKEEPGLRRRLAELATNAATPEERFTAGATLWQIQTYETMEKMHVFDLMTSPAPDDMPAGHDNGAVMGNFRPERTVIQRLTRIADSCTEPAG